MTAIPDEILAAAARGWKVFPIAAGTKNQPLVKWGTTEPASSNLDQIQKWAMKYPGCNWGCATGEMSGFFGIDLDSADALKWAVTNNLPMTGYLVKSGRNDPFACHLYFRQPSGMRIKTTQGKIALGVDVRGDGGMVVIPPSIHPVSGNPYRIVAAGELPHAPEWLIELVKDTRPERLVVVPGDLVPLTPDQIAFGRNIFLKHCREFAALPAGTGIRNGELNKLGFLAGGLIASGCFDSDYAKRAVLEYAASYIAQDGERETMRTWNSGLEGGLEKPWVPLEDSPEAAFGKGPPAAVARQVDVLQDKRPAVPPAPSDTFSDFLQDPRPKVRLPGDNRLLSDVASELGEHLSDALYTHSGEVVEHQDDSLHAVSAQQFRTLVERHVTCYRVRSVNESNVQVGASLNESNARGILASPQFRNLLRSLKHLNTVRLPVFRADKSLELLPEGYDVETATLTDVSASYAEDMPFADALAVIRDLYSEFQFTDGDRSFAVAVSALVGLYAKQLIPIAELRPAFTFIKNAEGAGATTLAACAIVPVLGHLPIGSKAKDDDEMRKALTSAIRTGQHVIFLDNVKGQLNSPALEAFVSAPTWTDRLLGANEVMTGPNNATVFITSNGLTVTPDWRRRSLFAELHLSEERAEDKVFARPLSVTILKAMRPKILAACWSLVRHWNALGRTQPSRSHSAFPAWASIIGGIMESAGFSCPFTTANVAVVTDEDGRGMRLLTGEMNPGMIYTTEMIVELCRRLGIFEGLVGATDADRGRAQRSAFGKLLARYTHRQVKDVWFIIAGSGHGKRFHVLRSEDYARLHGPHGPTPRSSNNDEIPMG